MQKLKSYVKLLFSPLFLTFFFFNAYRFSCPVLVTLLKSKIVEDHIFIWPVFYEEKGKGKETITAHQNNGKNKYRDGKKNNNNNKRKIHLFWVMMGPNPPSLLCPCELLSSEHILQLLTNE